MYDYSLIDAQYILTRNYYAIRGAADNELNLAAHLLIASSVISSVMKIQAEVKSRKIILLWDTYPYHKHSILSGDYKSERSYTTDEDVEEEGISDEERESRRIDANNLHQRSKAKYLLKSLGPLGLPSFFKSGYEADDLAYLASKNILSRGQTGIIVSKDSDWGFWINQNVSWMKLGKSNEIYCESDIRSENKIPDDLSTFKYKALYDSFYGSHNDLYQTCTDECWNLSFQEFYNKYKEFGVVDELFKDKELFKLQYSSFDIDHYPGIEKISGMMYYLDKTGGIPTPGQVDEFFSSQGMNVNSYNYCRMISSLDQSLYYD